MYEGGSTVYGENSCWCVHVCTSEHLEWLIPFVQQKLVRGTLCKYLSGEHEIFRYSVLIFDPEMMWIFCQYSIRDACFNRRRRWVSREARLTACFNFQASLLGFELFAMGYELPLFRRTHIHTYMYILHSCLAYPPPLYSPSSSLVVCIIFLYIVPCHVSVFVQIACDVVKGFIWSNHQHNVSLLNSTVMMICKCLLALDWTCQCTFLMNTHMHSASGNSLKQTTNGQWLVVGRV